MKRAKSLERRLAVIRERVQRGDYVISFTHTEKLRERKIGAGDIVCGRLEEEQILIVKGYEPDPAEWEADWRTRRR